VQDLIVVVVVLAFFGLCVAFVGGCGLILGSGELDAEASTASTEDGDPRDSQTMAA
jgi:hypothetical protein